MDSFQLFDPSDESGEAKLLEEANEEMSKIGGAPIQYYKLLKSQGPKNRYGEILDKLYEEPIELIVGIQNADISSELLKWGIDETLDYLITIDSKQIKEKLEAKPKKGDKIVLWNDEHVTVMNAIPQDSIQYHYHNYFITCKRVLSETDAENDELEGEDSPYQFK